MENFNHLKKACVITPDFVGPVKNGGIGTHAFYLSKFLVQEFHQDVTVIFTGPLESNSVAYWQEYYQSNFNIKFFHISQLPKAFEGTIYGGRLPLVTSLNIYHWLCEQDFDICFFQEWLGNGFASIQAKKNGQAFEHTILTCMIHSPSAWIREGMKTFPDRGLNDLVQDYLEKYSAENADICISPSQYMFDWVELKGWKIKGEKQLLPCMLEIASTPNYQNKTIKQLIFFGRLETRKGLEVFLDSLRVLASKLRQSQVKIEIFFLGKNGKCKGGDSKIFIQKFLSDYSDIYNYNLITDKDHPSALQFLIDKPDALVVIPSLIDNFPYTVLECVELNLNLIAAKTGGIPEILADDFRLFEPTPKALAVKIEEAIFEQLLPLNKKYSSLRAKESWKSFVSSIIENNIITFSNQTPIVSVCIPYYNCGAYLELLLKSLEEQTYKNFEVVIVNDGSTEARSQDIFVQMQQKYLSWTFLTKPNGGIGHTRNYAAKHSQGEYIVFMDADNVAELDMLERMVRGIMTSSSDCLTTYYRAFENDSDIALNNFCYAYTPVGNCPEGGIYENIFGDANFIIKKDVFLKLGGFREDRGTSNEDWEFLARLVLSGYSQDVIPNYLFFYRYIENSFSRTTNSYDNHLRAIRPYLEFAPEWEQKAILNSLGMVIKDKNSDFGLIQPLTPDQLNINPKLFHFLKKTYRKLSGGGISNPNPNPVSKFLINFRSFLAKNN